MAYLLDANVFITARKFYYGFDLCPGFWDWLDRAHRDGLVYSVRRVADELAGEDDIAQWAKSRPDFFLREDASTIPALATVSAYVQGKSHYTQAAINTFFQVADYYLVAQALAGGHTVVTLEQPDNSRNRVKIPAVCSGVGVLCINTFTMLRKQGVSFVLPRAG